MRRGGKVKGSSGAIRHLTTADFARMIEVHRQGNYATSAEIQTAKAEV
jgi:hypothetical protein